MPLVLIRHAMPHIDPATPAPTWHLGPEGTAAAAALAVPDGRHAASTEPKAAQTILAARPDAAVHTDAGFNEVGRPHDPQMTGERHRELAASYLAGAAHAGWEPQRRALERFDAAIARHMPAEGNLVVATHGQIMTLWLARELDLDDPVAYWRALAFPDMVTLETPAYPRRRPPAAT